jgi:hypothetical protein
MSADTARTARDLDALRQRAAQVRMALTAPVPPALPGDPVVAFQQQVAVDDATSALLEELARLAATAHVGNLLIETGERVPVAVDGAGPRVVGAAQTDPRIQLFAIPLAYSPVTMSFDADYARLGDFLWRLRDLATTVDVRSVEVRPRAATAPGTEAAAVSASEDGSVHVAMTLFAYSRTSPDNGSVARTAGSPAASSRSGEEVLP